MTRYEAIRNLKPERLEKFLDQVFLTGYNTGYQSLVDPDIDDDANPFEMDWLNDDAGESPALVENYNGEALIIEPLAKIILRMAEYDIDLLPDDIMWQSKIVLPQDVQNDTADSAVCEPVNEYGVSEDFEGDFDTWVANGKPDRGHIYVGITSPALKSIGVKKGKIFWDTSKLNKIQRDHPDMSDNILRQVPSVIGNPIIIMQSKTQLNRVTIYGEVYNDNGIPVLAVLELRPMSYGKLLLDTIKVANAYAREGGLSSVQGLINNSSVLYICPDKNRTDTWLTLNRLQLPFGISKYGSIGKVTYFERDVNGNYTFPGNYTIFGDKAEENETLPEWKAKLKNLNPKENKTK